jgi:DNA-directed RNA polymerase specialized sigma24 family protein
VGTLDLCAGLTRRGLRPHPIWINDRAQLEQAIAKTAKKSVAAKCCAFLEFELAAPSPDDQMLAVHELLDKLALKYPRHAEVVKLRYFVGMTCEEVAQLLDVSITTAKEDWGFSRAWAFQ